MALLKSLLVARFTQCSVLLVYKGPLNHVSYCPAVRLHYQVTSLGAVISGEQEQFHAMYSVVSTSVAAHVGYLVLTFRI